MVKWSRIGAGVIAVCLSMGHYPSYALGLQGLGVKVGVDLTRQESAEYLGYEFDSARLTLGGHVDFGSIFIPRLHLVPGVDLVIQDNLKIYSLNGEAQFNFGEGNTYGYVGGGIGVHLTRFDIIDTAGQGNAINVAVPNDTKVTLNIPVGFRKRVGPGVLWFGELKMIIADQEEDSSLRLSLGMAFGASD
ncbi:MAG: hypothetical protein OXU79_10035 [Gemmatimonadota bacterium]|nr:hypothetical protein [Gemmatimonadota bacterium]